MTKPSKRTASQCVNADWARGWNACVEAISEYEESGGGWLPIETAPKDGTEIIGWTHDAGRVICHWGKHNHVPIYGWIRRLELYGEEVDGFDPELWAPLLPPPPEDKR